MPLISVTNAQTGTTVLANTNNLYGFQANGTGAMIQTVQGDTQVTQTPSALATLWGATTAPALLVLTDLITGNTLYVNPVAIIGFTAISTTTFIAIPTGLYKVTQTPATIQSAWPSGA